MLEDALLPIDSGNPTEAFKKAWEILALHFASRTGLEIISMRIGGIWGPLYHSMANLPSRLTHGGGQRDGPGPGFKPAMFGSHGAGML